MICVIRYWRERMQNYKITRKIVGKGKQFSFDGRYTLAEKLSKEKELKDKRIIKETHYFKTKKRAELFISKDIVSDPASSWGAIFIVAKLRSYGAVKYRKY